MKLTGGMIPSRQQSGGVRSSYQGPRELLSADSSVAALGRVFGELGDQFKPYLNRRLAEEQEAEDYRDLQKRNQFEGEWARHAEARKQEMPEDGRGYLPTLEKDWGERSKAYLESISPKNREKYRAVAEGTWQNSALGADAYTRDAIKGDSLRKLDVEAERIKKELYLHPDDPDLARKLEEQVAAVPGLTSAEREELQIKLGRDSDGARVGGMIRNTREAAYTVPFSTDVSQRVVPAIVGQESGGNAAAESPKGASGLMQVMPATGAEIARALGDPMYPTNEADQKEYLKKPEVSMRYGTFYFNQQLQKYGGDIEVALIAYNAGPGRADDFLRAGRSYGVLPQETQKYVPSVFNRMGAMTPDMVFSPEFDLTFQQALGAESSLEQIYAKAASDAAQNVTANMAAAKERQEALLQSLYNQTEQGLDFATNYRKGVEEGMLPYDQSAFDKGQAIFERVNKEQLEYQAAVVDRSAGKPLTDKQGDMFVPPAVVNGVKERDQFLTTKMVNNVASMGFVPPAAVKGLNEMLSSPDIRQVAHASSVVAELGARNPAIVNALPQDMQTRAASFEALRGVGFPQDQIADRMQATATSEGRRVLASAREGKEYKDAKAMPASDVVQAFATFAQRTFGNLPGVELPTMTASSTETAKFQMQYGELFDNYFDKTQDAKLARDLAMTAMEKTWGVTDVGGNRIVTHLPPEKALQNIKFGGKNISLPPAFIRNQFDVEVRQVLPEGNFRVMATPQTEGAIAAGQPVPYLVMPTDENGEPAYDLSKPGQMEMMMGTFKFDYGRVVERIARTQGTDLPSLRRMREELLREDQRAQSEGQPAPATNERLEQIDADIRKLERESK